jgi:prepilin-type processing-associated H-X9-DG protein
MPNSILTTTADAYRMANAAYWDGHSDAWHALYSRAHGNMSREIYAALKAGRRAAIDEAIKHEQAAPVG